MEVIYTSPWVPVEWIAAHGHEPRGAWFAADNLPAAAVPEGVCAFAQAMVELAKSKPQAAMIFTTACDQMRRAADAAASQGTPRIFLFNLPATWQTPAARRLYHAEVERLGKFLVRLGGHSPTEAELETALNECEAKRARARALMEQSATRQSLDLLSQFDESGSAPSPPSPRESRADAIPLALLGGPLLPMQWPLFDAIESAGGRIVLNATEPGERSLLPPIPKPADGEPPITTLANRYFDHVVDVFQRPNSKLYDWLAPRLGERHVRGLVLWIHVGCDLWRAEAASLRETFGLPLLVLESHELHAGNLRDASRLAAFIESLQ